MSQSLALLRLLEPAVRPVAGPTPASAPPGQQPFEQQPFGDLLAAAAGSPDRLVDHANLADPAADPADLALTRDSPGPLGPLADFSRIENPGLRQLLADARAASSTAA